MAPPLCSRIRLTLLLVCPSDSADINMKAAATALLFVLLAALCADGLKIGAFNIQTFGRTKNSREHLMVYIEDVLFYSDCTRVPHVVDVTIVYLLFRECLADQLK